ncbi:MAG: glycosyltransferase family 4 protein [Vicinamibacteraceae bacterium]|nr:glycosyltransferase family 4 protein [Vicinamibacteraceae bacterium]
MSRIAVVTSHPPFTEGGHLVIARALVAALEEAGHRAEMILTPQNRFGRQAAAYAATWLTDVGESDGQAVDQVISLRFPSYAVRHPRHVCWLNHTMREYYDQWPQFSRRLSWKGRIKEATRRHMMHIADRRLLGPRHLSRLCAQSKTVQTRLRDELGLEAEVVYPPPPPRPYRVDGYARHLLAVSRLVPLKRVDLLVRALAEEAAAPVHLVVAGDGPERGALAALAASLGVADRVRFVGQVGDRELVDLYAACRAVVFAPEAEDYGFVTAEAFASSKAVITCHDSGGPAELVRDGITGLLVEPTPTTVAWAMRRLHDAPGEAQAMGRHAREAARELTWPAVLARLVIV